MFLTLGLQFQVWNLEISFQKWKNLHFFWLWGFNFKFGILKFHSENDSGASTSGLFWLWGFNFKFGTLKFHSKSVWLWGFNFRFGILKFHSKIEKRGFNFRFGTLKFHSKNENVCDCGASISGLEPWNFIPKMKKHDCGASISGLEPCNFIPKLEMFLTLGLQFQVWNLEQ